MFTYRVYGSWPIEARIAGPLRASTDHEQTRIQANGWLPNIKYDLVLLLTCQDITLAEYIRPNLRILLDVKFGKRNFYISI